MITYEDFELGGEIYKHVKCDHYMRRDDGLEIYEDLILPDEHTYEETDREIGQVDDYELAAKILLGMEE